MNSIDDLMTTPLSSSYGNRWNRWVGNYISGSPSSYQETTGAQDITRSVTGSTGSTLVASGSTLVTPILPVSAHIPASALDPAPVPAHTHASPANEQMLTMLIHSTDQGLVDLRNFLQFGQFDVDEAGMAELEEELSRDS